jgi:dipeptidyl aminopeptidase/acylaminoacyl peptidase
MSNLLTRYRFAVLLVIALFGTYFSITVSASDEASRPIRLTDVLSVREITEQQISPNGQTVAFVVKDADIQANDYNYSLYVVSTDGASDPKLLAQAKTITAVRWEPHSDQITYISNLSKLSQIWSVRSVGGEPVPLFKHPENISQFEWSPDGSTVAFISSEPVDDKETARAAENGITYDDHLMFPFWEFISRSWVRKPTRVWLFRVHENKVQKLWEQEKSIHYFESVSVTKLAWAPDGERIALEFNTSASTSKNAAVVFDSGVGVLSVREGGLVPLPTTNAFQVKPSWSPDGKSVAFITETSTQGEPRDGFRASIFMSRLGQAACSNLTPSFDVSYSTKTWWSNDGSKILFAMEGYHQKTALYELLLKDGSIRQVSRTEDHLSECSLDATRTRASCVEQNPMKPPEIAVIDLIQGNPKTLTHLNSAFDQITLGQVSEIKWKNKYGIETNGYLIKPIGYTPGQRYPFLLTLYHFEGKFITQAEWISSYPAQVFAANGFAVLLMNQPREYSWSYGNFEQFAFDRDYNALASIQPAVDAVTQMGIADPKRAGIMGWSYGSELTNETLTHSKLFAAASASSGGAYNQGEYWLSGEPFQHYLEGVMGGSPYGGYNKGFDDLSTAAQARHVSAPLLIESSPQEMLLSLEFYTALRRGGKPVELVIYPDEGHIYEQPKHRLASMQRNLDWFLYWLQGREDSQPEKQEQYRRWKAMAKNSTEP